MRAAVGRLSDYRKVEVSGEFVTISRTRACHVRDRSDLTGSSVRDAENLPPQEIAQAAVMLIKVNSSAESDELIRAVANVMGFRQAGSKFRSVAEIVVPHGCNVVS